MPKKNNLLGEGFKRNNELENIIGNLLVAQNQVERLQNKLLGLQTWVDGITPIDTNTTSTFPFIYNGKMYKIHVVLEKPADETKNESVVVLEE